VAVATEREYGLFINGEWTEPSAGELKELVEPATGDALELGPPLRPAAGEPLPSQTLAATREDER